MKRVARNWSLAVIAAVVAGTAHGCTKDAPGRPDGGGGNADADVGPACVDGGVDSRTRHQVAGFKVYYGTLHDHVYGKKGGDDGGLIVGEFEPSQTGSPAWVQYRQQNPSKYTGGDPRSAILKARASGLDFFALTPHNHLIDNEELADIVAAVQESRCSPFTVFQGQEYSTVSSGNHVVVMQVDFRIGLGGGEYASLYNGFLPSYEAMHPERAGKASERPFVICAHPSYVASEYPSTVKAMLEYGIDDFPSLTAFADASNKYVRLVELLSGSGGDSQNRSRALEILNQGVRVGMSAGEDNHEQMYGTRTDGRVAVLATAPTPAGIAEALYERRTYATEDPTVGVHVAVKLAAGDKYMGADVTAAEAGGMLSLELGLSDPDEPSASYRVEVLRDDAVGGALAQVVTVPQFAANVGQGTHSFQVATPPAGGYVLFHIVQQGSRTDDVWVSPVFIR